MVYHWISVSFSFIRDDNIHFFFFFPQKYLVGSRLCFHKGRNKEWQDIEDFARSEGCGKEDNLSVSAYKVALSSDTFPSMAVVQY